MKRKSTVKLPEGIPLAISAKSAQTTFAPSAANANEIPLLNPDEEPVTTATLPFSLVLVPLLALVSLRPGGLQSGLLIMKDQ